MFDFTHVIEDGTIDEIKDCVLAVVCPEPLPKQIRFTITSTKINCQARKLSVRWTGEHQQELVMGV